MYPHTNVTTVNELSNTIDLPSTLLRAETLFRRFQRTVDAIDKKNNFPAPSLRQRKPAKLETENGNGKPSAATTGANAGPSVGKAVAQGIAAEKEKVISPELRALLSRKVVLLEKNAVVESGGGV